MVKAATKPVKASVNKPNMTRDEIDAFIRTRRAEQLAARAQQPQQASPYISGFANLMNILTGQSPLQQNKIWGKK